LFKICTILVTKLNTKNGGRTMKARMLVCVIVIFVFGISTQCVIADDFDWPRWRGPNGDGISMETDWNPNALTGEPKILWKVDLGWGHSNVAIKNNRLYTIGMKGVYCLNPETGEEIWLRPLEDSYRETYTTPTIEGKYLYTLSSEGVLYCLKSKNGKVRWETDLISEYDVVIPQNGFGGSPIIEGDLVILNLNLSGIALDKNTGKKVWISEKYHPSNVCPQGKNMASYATPVIFDWEGKRCALMYHCTGLYSVDVQTGEQLWYFEFMALGAKAADPIFFENKVFISTGYIFARCVLIEITGNKPKEVWENENMRNEFSSCVFIDGYLYGSDGDNSTRAPFRCIDAKTGDVLWEKKMKMASLTAADEKLIILEEDGHSSYRGGSTISISGDIQW
jgi:outer membrane protein assembly factor BamB